jgi:hypothetical protein
MEVLAAHEAHLCALLNAAINAEKTSLHVEHLSSLDTCIRFANEIEYHLEKANAPTSKMAIGSTTEHGSEKMYIDLPGNPAPEPEVEYVHGGDMEEEPVMSEGEKGEKEKREEEKRREKEKLTTAMMDDGEDEDDEDEKDDEDEDEDEDEKEEEDEDEEEGTVIEKNAAFPGRVATFQMDTGMTRSTQRMAPSKMKIVRIETSRVDGSRDAMTIQFTGEKVGDKAPLFTEMTIDGEMYVQFTVTVVSAVYSQIIEKLRGILEKGSPDAFFIQGANGDPSYKFSA